MGRRFLQFMIISLFIFGITEEGYSWKEQTHKYHLTSSALSVVGLTGKEKYDPRIWTDFRTYIMQGSWDEDFPCGSSIRANNHYRQALSGRGLSDAPFLGLGERDVDTLAWALKNESFSGREEFGSGDQWNFKGWGWTESDVDFGVMSWEKAIERYGYRDDSKKLAYYTLGFILHLLQDMGCTEHVHDDPHAASGYTGFEMWVYEKWEDLKPDIKSLKPKEFPRVRDYFVNLSLLGYSIDRFHGGELKRTEPYIDQNSDLARMFKVSYSLLDLGWHLGNHNGETIIPMIPTALEAYFRGSSNVQNITFGWNPKKYRKNPLWTKGHDEGEWWPTSVENVASPNAMFEPMNDKEGFYYIELSGEFPGEPIGLMADPIRNLYPQGFLPTCLPEVAAQCKGWRDPSVKGVHLYQLMGKRIFPPIIEHSAGLIKHYFDIVNHPPYVKKVEISQGGQRKYSAYWKDKKKEPLGSETITDVETRELVHEIGGTSENPFTPGELSIGITFSEPVKDVTVKVRNKTIQGFLAGDETTWWGGCVIEEEGPQHEVRTISITAIDKNDHYKNEGGLLDRDPRTPAKRMVSDAYLGEYEWRRYESGEDTNHSIKIKRPERKTELLQQPAVDPQVAKPAVKSTPKKELLSDAEAKALQKELWDKYYEKWKKEWCVTREERKIMAGKPGRVHWSGCAEEPHGVLGGLQGSAWRARTREQQNVVRSLAACQDACMMNDTTQQVRGRCIQDCIKQNPMPK